MARTIFYLKAFIMTISALEFQCQVHPDGSLEPVNHFTGNIITVTTNTDVNGQKTGSVAVMNSVIAYLSYDFSGNRVVGYTPTYDNPTVMKTMERLFPLL
ncbi:hypothetical protein D6_0123 [Aeromonas phage D6]|uniref:Uncharacterized protein n=1 Tax=Aeromonas phage D6 TaxID=2593322 RepID=A0A514TWA6_9CAUD|nr:hypothetical protein PQC08_gp152 [Aeromonas phage D6]QDJ97283.1 hypothetical protein D6_0123 [Aeromonas phage D6]